MRTNTNEVAARQIHKLVAKADTKLMRVSNAVQQDRGDVPGWVLVTVMTAGLVVALWSVADGQLRSILGNALASVSQP